MQPHGVQYLHAEFVRLSSVLEIVESRRQVPQCHMPHACMHCCMHFIETFYSRPKDNLKAKAKNNNTGFHISL